MSSDHAALAFLLDGPLQSWGTSSRFQRRSTDPYPSKSGVLGMIAAALGIDKHSANEAEQLRPLSALHFSVYRVSRVIDEERVAVLRLGDYHTVGGGYDDKTHWGELSTPRKASGGAFGTVLTQREYLTDAVFAAVLRGPRPVLEDVATGLDNPVWGVWLGRKCCVPATPVSTVIANEAASALAEVLAKARAQGGRTESTMWSYLPDPILLCRDLESGESTAPQDGADTCPDQPLTYGRREHTTRTVRQPGT
jgi:CRISPR system Cascade subunit CasD